MRILVILVFSLSSIQFLNAQVIHNQIPIKLETPHNWDSNKTMEKTAVYTAPAGHYIISAQQVVLSQNGPGSSSVTTSQQNSSLISIQEVKSTFEEERNFVLNLDISEVLKADLLASIDARQQAYESRYYQLASSHSSVIHHALVRGQGRLSFNGRSWYNGKVSVHLVSSGPEFENISSFRSKAETDFNKLLEDKNIKLTSSATLTPINVKPNRPVVIGKVQKIQKLDPGKLKKNRKQ